MLTTRNCLIVACVMLCLCVCIVDAGCFRWPECFLWLAHVTRPSVFVGSFFLPEGICSNSSSSTTAVHRCVLVVPASWYEVSFSLLLLLVLDILNAWNKDMFDAWNMWPIAMVAPVKESGCTADRLLSRMLTCHREVELVRHALCASIKRHVDVTVTPGYCCLILWATGCNVGVCRGRGGADVRAAGPYIPAPVANRCSRCARKALLALGHATVRVEGRITPTCTVGDGVWDGHKLRTLW